MKFIYPAVFHKTENGRYEGYFPDLECCYGEGETLDDAIDSANDAMRDWITLELSEEEPLMPYVSDISDMNLKEGEIYVICCCNRFPVGGRRQRKDR